MLRNDRTGLAMVVALALVSLLVSAASAGASPAADGFTVFAGDYEALRADFNAAKGKIRAVFLASPTCGICLRGADELRETMLEQIPAEDLAVFVVWSSQLGAEEKHVAPAMRLITDARAKHYWDGDKLVGIDYQGPFGIPGPAWDIWMLYDRETEWGADVAPTPAWWEHQLTSAGLPKDLELDADRFAKKTRELLGE